MRRYVSLAALALALFMCASVADAQDFRGGITGRITDAQGGRLPGVTVTATHMAPPTSSSTATTDTDGRLSISYLAPGAYKVTAELSGFKKAAREGVEVRIGDRLELALSLEVGSFEETVSVAADAPLLETRSGSAGQVIDEKRIALMPLSDGNPVRAGASRAWRVLPRRPEVLAPVRQRRHVGLHRRRRARPQRVHARRFAQHGQRPPRGVRAASRRRAGVQGRDGDIRRAAGPHRRRHGQRDAQERHQPGPRRRLLPLPRRSAVGERLLPRARRPAQGRHRLQTLWLHRRRPGVLGKLYDGRDKTFFFTAFEWLYDTFPEPGQFTVPTAAQRNGDFSALLVAGHQTSTIRSRPCAAPTAASSGSRSPATSSRPIASARSGATT